MKVRERIELIADLMLGALYADRRFESGDQEALCAILCDLLVQEELPDSLAQHIAAFVPEEFCLARAACDFRSDPPMHPRRLLQLTSELCFANGEVDLDEDEYLHKLARALGLRPEEYDDIVLDYEVQLLADAPPARTCIETAAARSFPLSLRTTSPR